jgi:hypothetical protein
MRDLKPCGTIAAYRRHLRHGEPPCESCLEAQRRANADERSHHAGTQAAAERRASRNGLPGFRPYQWRPTPGRARRAEDAGREADFAWSADVNGGTWPGKVLSPHE